MKDNSKQPQKVSNKTSGFCIRCGKEMELNPNKPLCSKCYPIWAKYSDPDYPEKYCHICGKESEQTYAKPVCYTCYKKKQIKTLIFHFYFFRKVISQVMGGILQDNYNPTCLCEGWDSNPRTPTRLGPQPSAFDLAWLPSLSAITKRLSI